MLYKKQVWMWVKMKKIKKKLKNYIFIYNLFIKIREFWYKNFISDEKCIKKRFKKRMGREVNLENPVKYNDKLQWLKLNWRDPVATKCADKYKVREFVKNKIGKKYLNKIYGVYDSVDEINIKNLPQSFVLKATHGSGKNIICKNKNSLNWKKKAINMKGWLKTNHYWINREWVYKDIKPKIICEKYLENKNGNPPKDYKIFCFNGEPKLIEVDFDRFSSHTRNFYDLDWNLLNLEIEYPNDKNTYISKPEKLNEMLKLSKILSEDFPHVRVDFYNLNGELIFGELTFFHESGTGKFNLEKYEIKMGNWLTLPNKH